MNELLPLSPITVIAGHYGVGKTNFSLNLALAAQERGQEVTLMDVDIVNPYFRSSDYTDFLESRGIRIVAPVFAQSMLDTPSLPGSMQAAIEHASDTHPLIIDMGGDDEGAKAMGRFSSAIKSGDSPYTMLYVINERREIESPEETAQMLKDIERRCKIKATGVVNNTHLSEETTLSVVEASAPFAEKTASLLGLPIVCTAVPARYAQQAHVVRPFPVRSPRAHAVGIASDTLSEPSKKRRKKRCQKVKTCTRPTEKAPSPCVQRPLRRYSEETTLKGRFVRTLKSLPRLRPVPRRRHPS